MPGSSIDANRTCNSWLVPKAAAQQRDDPQHVKGVNVSWGPIAATFKFLLLFFFFRRNGLKRQIFSSPVGFFCVGHKLCLQHGNGMRSLLSGGEEHMMQQCGNMS